MDRSPDAEKVGAAWALVAIVVDMSNFLLFFFVSDGLVMASMVFFLIYYLQYDGEPLR
jgi:hypothetical protein